MDSDELRELDAWIGENVFGMHKFDNNKTNHSLCETCGHGHDFSGHYSPDWTAISKSLPCYTTDPAAAMLVLEKCISKLGWYRILNLGTTSVGNFFANHCDPEPDSEAFCDVDAPTLPLAICLFSKKLFSK